MKIQYILASAALLIAVLLASTAISAPINTNVTNATMEIELSKSSFSINETITGILRIPLNQDMDAEQEIELRIQLPMKRVTQTKTLNYTLTNASFTFTQSEPTKAVSNPSATKTLSFSDGGEKSVAIKADSYSAVESIDMDISAPESNTLNNVKIDVGNDGIIDWYYLGTKTSVWASEFTKPEGLSDTAEEQMIINNNNTMICQAIDLPFAKDFQVSAWYKRLNTAGNITAAIIDIDGFDEPQITPIPNVLSCDLPENADMGWGSCEISGAEYGLHGKYLVCVYSTNGTGIGVYELNAGAVLQQKRIPAL